MARLKLYLLGPPQVELEDDSVKIQRRKVLALLAYLAVSGEVQRRDTLATLLWPDLSQSQARASLTRHLSEGRKIIGQDSLITDRETVELASAVWVDVDRFRQLIERSSSSPDSLDSLTEAVSLYRDDFLTGFTLPECPDYDEWQFFQTEGLRQQLALTLEHLINLHIDQANFEVAIPYARRWLVLDPLHEPAHQQLMQLYAWRGQWAAAMRQYETCLRLLEEELGVPPTAETEQLYQAVKAKQLTTPVLQAEPRKMAGNKLAPAAALSQSPGQSEKRPLGRRGRYELMAEIGQGGFATVYRAYDPDLTRQVALKVLAIRTLSGTDWGDRFRREARMIAGLEHPRILPVYDVGQAGGQPFIVMRLIEGPDLDERLTAQGRLSWSEAVSIMRAVADGLDYAHAQRVLHRDLKPANILIDTEQGPLLSDFGLAKLIGGSGHSLTAGGIVGTPHYIAPEVWEDQGASPQSDIYALGCIFYEMLTGERLFDGDSPPAVMRAHFKPLTLPENWPEGLPLGVVNILERALAQQPNQRYATANDLVTALSQLPEESQAIVQVRRAAPEGQKSPPVSLEERGAAILDRPLVVAREAELAQLDGFLEQAIAGQGRVVFITGEAGAGKTTLVSEFIHQAQQNKGELLSVVGNCNAQTGRGDPYLPFRDVLGLLTGDVEDKLAQGAISIENARRLRKFFNVSGQVLVELGPMLINTLMNGAKLAGRIDYFGVDKSGWSGKLRRVTTTEATEKPDLSQAYIFEQYTAVLQALAAKQPLVLWLDDLHWVDAASADLLFHLGRRLERSQILVLGTYRPEEIALGRGAEAHPLANVVSEFKRSWGNIQVDLDQARLSEGRHFVEALLDTEPNHLDETFRQTMYNHTGGQPLFTVELLRDLQERSELVPDDSGYWIAGPTLDWGRVPARVEGVIEKRIGRLDIDLQEALTTASVEGEQFTVEIVAQVQGLATPELVRRLSREVDKQHRLVQAQGSQHLGGQRLSRYQFRHNVIRNYLYERLDAVERTYLHEAVGHKLEDLSDGQVDVLEAHLEALAYHFYEAGLWSKALTYAQRAGEKALTLQAPQDAIEQFTQALDAAAMLSQQPMATLYRLRGQAFDTLGHFDQAQADYEAAQEAARTAGDQYQMWQTLLDLGQLWASRNYKKSSNYCHQALDLARLMEDQAAIGHSLNRLGNWLMNTGQPFAALNCHQEALEQFESRDDQPGIAATLDLLAATSFFCGKTVGAVAYYERAIHILRDLNNHQTLISSLANLALNTLNEIPVREAISLAQESEWRSGEAFALHNLGLILSTRGDYGQGLRVLKSGRELTQAIDHRMWQAAFNIDLGVTYGALLAFDEARRHLESGLEIARGVGANIMITYASGCLAALYIRQQRFDEAARLLPDLPVKPIMGQDYWLVKPAVELILINQGAAGALQVLDQQDLPDRSNWRGWIAYFYGGILQLRGELLIELGQFDEAETAMQSVLDLYLEQGIRMDLWRIHLALGRIFRATENLQKAKTAFATAQILVEELASTVTDEALGKTFRQQAIDLIPPSQQPMPY